MPLFRLIGLALLITAIFLALAAAITKTTHIRIQLPGTNNALRPPVPSVPVVLPPPIEPVFGIEPQQAEINPIQFTSVPIVWPLIIAAGMGLLMWFIIPTESWRRSSTSKRNSRRRK